MCLVLLALYQHPAYPIIILSNRDEYNHRKSMNANFWTENPNIFAGIDEAKGTWLGINLNGNFGFITNFRNSNLNDPSKLSRGLLVKDYLMRCTEISPLSFLTQISQYADDFNGFNLLLGNVNEVFYYSNIEKKIKHITPGVYCVSNHLLDTPWYKVTKAKQLFAEKQKLLSKCDDPDAITQELYKILSDNTLAPDNQLPQTGMDKKLEKLLSPIFVDIHSLGEYGTQSSSIVLIDKTQKTLFYEKIFKKGVPSSYEKTIVNPTKKSIGPKFEPQKNQFRKYTTSSHHSSQPIAPTKNGFFSIKKISSSILPEVRKISSVLKKL